MVGVRLYRPGVIALYFVLGGLPLGCFLYGLNVARRGDRLFGYALVAVATIAYALLIAAIVTGVGVSGFGILGVFVGLGVMYMEGRPYRNALASGATPARWWPPLLFLAFLFVSLSLVLLMVTGE